MEKNDTAEEHAKKTQATIYFPEPEVLDQFTAAAKADNRPLSTWLLMAGKEKLEREKTNE